MALGQPFGQNDAHKAILGQLFSLVSTSIHDRLDCDQLSPTGRWDDIVGRDDVVWANQPMRGLASLRPWWLHNQLQLQSLFPRTGRAQLPSLDGSFRCVIKLPKLGVFPEASSLNDGPRSGLWGAIAALSFW
jgi:hypothetical protein